MSAPAEFDTASTPLASGVTLLEASAGTGKTFAIEGLFLRLIAEHGVGIAEILVCTFTNAATRELSARIRSRMLAALLPGSDDPVMRAVSERVGAAHARSRLSAAVASFDSARIFTIHGFCSRVVSEHAFESRALFGSSLANDGAALCRKAAADHCRRAATQAPLALLALRLAGMAPEDTLAAGVLARGPDRAMPLRPELPAWEPAVSEASLSRRLSEIGGQWGLAKAPLMAFLNDPSRANKPLRDLAGLVSRGMDALAGGGIPGASSIKAILALTPENVAAGTNRKSKTGAPDLPLLGLCGAFRKSLDHALAALLGDFMGRADELVDQYRERDGSLGFDDLIRMTAEALRGGGSSLCENLRRRYRVGLVDEFQDTDRLQWEIFRNIFAGDAVHSLYIIGDPKQAIYRFRGADVRAYLAAAAEAPQRFSLAVNWRSDANLVEAVNALFSATDAPFGDTGISFAPVRPSRRADPAKAFAPGSLPGEPLRMILRPEELSASTEWMKSRLVGDVCALLSSDATIGGRSVTGSDVAVIVRKHAQAAAVCQALAAAGVQAVEESDASVFDSPQAADMRDFLSAALNPSDPGALRWALAGGVFRFGAEAVRSSDSGADDAAELVRGFAGEWETSGFMTAFRRLDRETRLRSRLLAVSGGERALTNLLHLSELLNAAERDGRLRPGALSRWLSEMISDESLRPQDGHQLRLESDAGAVRVITCHKSKGLEFPIVFAPFFPGRGGNRGGSFAVSRKEGRPVLWYARDGALPDEVEAEADAERLLEESRLLYVLLTRARSRCTVYLAPDSLSPGTLGGALGEVLGAADWPELGDALRRLAVANPACVDVSFAPMPETPPRLSSPECQPELAFKPFAGSFDARPFVTSFSALHGSARPEAPDRVDDVAIPEPETELTGIAAFPRGAAAGTFFHSCLEKMDFADDSLWREVVDKKRKAAGIDATWLDTALDNLSGVIKTPLAPNGPLLFGLAPRDILREEEFYFPAKKADVAGMAAAFAAEKGPLARQAGELARLPHREVDGYLKGYIDLVFRSGGALHILDWKSNWLGDSPAAYTDDALDAAMCASAYYLQGAIYALALRRSMAVRAREWDYERDFGGVWYVFLRGVVPGRPGSGVVNFRPSPALLDALEESFDARTEALR